MKFKKLVIPIIIAILLIFNSNIVLGNDEGNESENIDISAQAAFLMDNRTKKVIYQKNETEKMYPASTTKIMTAILTLENCNLDEKVTASYNAVTSIPDGYSSANIQIGEELTVEQLLELLLVHSANDAANVLAEYVGRFC